MRFIKTDKDSQSHALTQAMSALRDQLYTELDEHREAINADTTELSVVNTRLEVMERKIEHLATRMESIQRLLMQDSTPAPLTVEEQQLFLTLYTSDDTSWVSYSQVALKAGLSPSNVPALVESLAFKNVPVQQECFDGECYIRIQQQFKQLQAKHNIVSVSEHAKQRTQMRQHVTLDRFQSF